MTDFGDQLGRQFDRVAAVETRRIERRRRVAGVMTAAVVVGVGAFAWSAIDRPAVELETTSLPAAEEQSGGTDEAPLGVSTDEVHDSSSTAPPDTADTTGVPDTVDSVEVVETRETTGTAAEPVCPAPIEAGTDQLSDLGAASGPKPWVDGVTISAFAADGTPVDLVRSGSTGGVGPTGGRYDYQIDYMPELDAAERIVLAFDPAVCRVDIGVTHLESADKEGHDELLTWTAHRSDGAALADGVLDRSAGRVVERTVWFTLPVPTGTVSVELGAAPYAPGAAVAGDNESDYSIVGLRIG